VLGGWVGWVVSRVLVLLLWVCSSALLRCWLVVLCLVGCAPFRFDLAAMFASLPMHAMHVIVEFLDGPLPMHHEPTYQLVAGVTGRLAIAKALSSLEKWLHTLYSTALSWKHFPPRGNRIRDILAIFYKTMRVIHTPSFLTVHTLFLPALDALLLPTGIDLGLVLFGAQVPEQIPSWLQFGFVVRQIVHHLREQMQARGLFWEASYAPSTALSSTMHEMPWVLLKVISSLMIFTEFAFRHNRLRMYWLVQDSQLLCCQKHIFHYSQLATLSAHVFHGFEWGPYERDGLLQVAVLLQFSRTWPAAGSRVARGGSRDPTIAGGTMFTRQAYVLQDQLSWHGKACPIGLFLMDALDGMMSDSWKEHISLYDGAAWHTPTNALEAGIVFTHLYDTVLQLLSRQAFIGPADWSHLGYIIGNSPEHLDDWPHHPPASAHGLYSSARIALLLAVAQPPLFAEHIGIRRGHDLIKYVADVAHYMCQLCAAIVAEIDYITHGQVASRSADASRARLSSMGLPAIIHPMPWIWAQRVSSANAVADRLSRSAYHPGPFGSTHLHRNWIIYAYTDVSTVSPRSVTSTISISSSPSMSLHRRWWSDYLLQAAGRTTKGRLLAIIQLDGSVFVQDIALPTSRSRLTHGMLRYDINRQVHVAFHTIAAAACLWTLHAQHGRVTKIADCHAFSHERLTSWVTHFTGGVVARAHCGRSALINIIAPASISHTSRFDR